MKQLLREYWIELTFILLALLGIFLLVEQMEIGVTLLRIARTVWHTASSAVATAVKAMVYRVLQTTISDRIGLVLIVMSAVAALWRGRVRVIRRLAGRTCPVCGGELHRTPRRWQDRLLSLLVPVVRRQCNNKECRWEGLSARARH